MTPLSWSHCLVRYLHLHCQISLGLLQLRTHTWLFMHCLCRDLGGEIGQERKKWLPFTYQLRFGVPLQLMWSSSVCQDDSCCVIFSCNTQLCLDFPLQFLQEGFSSCPLFSILSRSQSIVLTSCRPVSSQRVTLGGRKEKGTARRDSVI